MKKASLFLSVMTFGCLIASEESIKKLFSDTFYVYKKIITNMPDLESKKEMHEGIELYNHFFKDLLHIISEHGLPDCLQQESLDFENPMIKNNPYKFAYGNATFHFLHQIESVRVQNEKDLFLNGTLPLQQDFVLEGHKKVIQLVIESPSIALQGESSFLDEYQKYTSFYENHVLIDPQEVAIQQEYSGKGKSAVGCFLLFLAVYSFFSYQ